MSEWAEQPIPDTAGSWTVSFIEQADFDDYLDALAEEGTEADIDYNVHCQQLVLTRQGADATALFDQLTWVGTYPIDGARFTVADTALAPLLATSDGFDRYLDGAHGLIADGRGVHVHLGGDGRGELFLASSDGVVGLVHIDLL